MRGLFWVLALFALAVGLSMALRFNDGFVLVVLPPWRLEISLNLALAALAGAFLLLYGALRGVALTLGLPARVRAYRARKRKEKAASLFQDAVRLLFEGRFGHALNKAAEAHGAGEVPGLAALIAARAAQRMRETAKQEFWLDRATADDTRTAAARLMLEAEMYLDARRHDEAIAVLARLQQTTGRHIAALRLELRARQGAGHWDEVLRIVRQLEKRKAMSADAARELRLQAHCANIARCASDRTRLIACLDRIPAGERGTRVAREAVRALLALGARSETRQIIEEEIGREWDSALIARYAEADGEDDALARIARAEGWLAQHPDDPALLVALGRLCMIRQLWGKAQSYLDAALSLADTRDTRLVLAALAERLGRAEEANRHYRAAAQLSGED